MRHNFMVVAILVGGMLFAAGAVAGRHTNCGKALEALGAANDVNGHLVPGFLGEQQDYEVTGGTNRPPTTLGWLNPLAHGLSSREITVRFSPEHGRGDDRAGRFIPPFYAYLPHEALGSRVMPPSTGHEIRHALFFKELWLCVTDPRPPALSPKEWDPGNRSLAHGTLAVRFVGQKFDSPKLQQAYGADVGHGIDETLYAYGYEIPIHLQQAVRGVRLARAAGLERSTILEALLDKDLQALKIWQDETPAVAEVRSPPYDRRVIFSDGTSVEWSSVQVARRLRSWDITNDDRVIPVLLEQQLNALKLASSDWARRLRNLPDNRD